MLLEAKGLIKRFGKLTAVDGVSLSIETGSCTGLLGPNGAGKTTTVSMLAGLLEPDGGEVLITGQPLRGDSDPGKRRIGLVPQDLALYEDLTSANREFVRRLRRNRDGLQAELRSALLSARHAAHT